MNTKHFGKKSPNFKVKSQKFEIKTQNCEIGKSKLGGIKVRI